MISTYLTGSRETIPLVSGMDYTTHLKHEETLLWTSPVWCHVGVVIRHTSWSLLKVHVREVVGATTSILSTPFSLEYL